MAQAAKFEHRRFGTSELVVFFPTPCRLSKLPLSCLCLTPHIRITHSISLSLTHTLSLPPSLSLSHIHTLNVLGLSAVPRPIDHHWSEESWE